MSRSIKKLNSVGRQAEYIFFIPNQNTGIGLSREKVSQCHPARWVAIAPPKSGSTGKNGYFRHFFKIELPTVRDLFQLHTSYLR